MHLELGEQPRSDADDHRQHQHLDAGGHHVAQHLLGQERGLVPQREGHQHEARERGQLELDEGDEQLHRQHEEADDDHQPGQEQDDDGVEIDEHLGETGQFAYLLQDRRAGVDAGFRQPPRLQESLHAERAGCRQAQPGEGAEDDAGQPVEVADDVGKGTDVEHLADQLRHHVLALAGGVTERPVEPGNRHIDRYKRGGQVGDFPLQQPESRVDVAREGIEEAVDDRDIVHGASSLTTTRHAPLSATSSPGSSKVGGIGGNSPRTTYSSGPEWPAKKRRWYATAAALHIPSPTACQSAAHSARRVASRAGWVASVSARPSQDGRSQAASKAIDSMKTLRMAAILSSRRTGPVAGCTACPRPGSVAEPRGRARSQPPAALAPARPRGPG
ncbi:hypothetical protein PAERUG_P1_London_28_IMP_1_04_05_01842 [Pseudomonas aeruginosa]|nr:hypothetical protein PAERUG_P1_London_28_IMP_1_04_05_01842 [Pseudomonas aeruginosa]CRS16806.1 hypothetical protein PAERUG_P48_London_17_VIM_2_01_13_05028 [Pseudomonas aeruginosa]CRW76732.1 hypothetical protein PAERUG_P62_London_9_VIM_2_01_14_01125 [Pseudomonas aeruginosa]CRW96476.1 hypothetical protein PAERUG_P54_1_London_24_VIM_2_04_13_01113 [Pseudomonas aeruginosa]